MNMMAFTSIGFVLFATATIWFPIGNRVFEWGFDITSQLIVTNFLVIATIVFVVARTNEKLARVGKRREHRVSSYDVICNALGGPIRELWVYSDSATKKIFAILVKEEQTQQAWLLLSTLQIETIDMQLEEMTVLDYSGVKITVSSGISLIEQLREKGFIETGPTFQTILTSGKDGCGCTKSGWVFLKTN